ncbi:MAG: hypothetical protein SGI90_14550 [Candidatus Eisenbacteria bacterium]|nr:hypothetical protein [Candidatus Eisenbacteria bacterium]
MLKNGSKTGLAILVIATVGGAMALLAGAGLPDRFDTIFWAWFVSCLAGEVLWIQTPTRNGTISMALAIDLAALIALHPSQSLVIVAASALLASIYPHRRPLKRALFNAAQSTLAAGAALLVVRLLTPVDSTVAILDQYTNWPGLFAGGIAFFAVNSGLVAMAIALDTSRSIWMTWRDNFGYAFELATTAAQISLAGFLLIAYQQMGPMAVLAVLPVLGVLWWSSARESALKAIRVDIDRPTAETEGHEDDLRRAG